MSPEEPAITREGALTLVAHFATTDRLPRAPDGARGALVTDDGAWVLDLDEARVVTWIPAPQRVRDVVMPDAETLCVLDHEGVLRVYALPDGGCVGAFHAPGAWAIAGHTTRTVLLWGDATLRVADDGARFERMEGGAFWHHIDLRVGAHTAVDGARFARALSALPGDAARLAADSEPLTPWGALSPDGDAFAFSIIARARGERPWSLGDLDDQDWSHAYTLRLDDPEATLARWAAPLEGWTLEWRAPDELTSYLGVATGPPPYRTMPFARRRIRRDGAVVTWRAPDTDLLLAPRASALATDLDDGRFLAWVTAARAAHAITWDPATEVTETRDLLADVPLATLAPDAPVQVLAWPDGAIARALPRRDGGARVTVDGATIAESPARLGPPTFLRPAGPDLTLQWTPQRDRWRSGFVRRRG